MIINKIKQMLFGRMNRKAMKEVNELMLASLKENKASTISLDSLMDLDDEDEFVVAPVCPSTSCTFWYLCDMKHSNPDGECECYELGVPEKSEYVPVSSIGIDPEDIVF